MFQIIFLFVLSYHLWNFPRRMKLFIFAEDHLMNNLSLILKLTFLKLIGKKLKLYKIHVMPTHFFRTVVNIIWYLFSTKKKIKIKNKDLQSPWITNAIKKYPKRKERLYNKFLKNRNKKKQTEYKNYKNLFEAIKNVLKRTTFPN